jgi:hypothetical protein
LRSLIRLVDSVLRQRMGVFEFCTDPECILRLEFSTAPHKLLLSTGEVPKGAPTLVPHLWNERVPKMGSGGADLAWAVSMSRLYRASLHKAADWLVAEPDVPAVRALGGATALLLLGEGSLRSLQRIGYEVFPYHNSLGRFGEFWQNLYTWLLMWTFNPVSVRGKSPFGMHRAEGWMPIEVFLSRYGPQG